MINGIKEFFNITLQGITSSGVILGFLAQHLLYRRHSFMSTFPQPTRKRMGDKGGIKNPIQDLENSMMQNSIANTGLMNMALFGIRDIEISISAMLVRFVFQLAVKLKDINFQPLFKAQDIDFPSFAPLKPVPG